MATPGFSLDAAIVPTGVAADQVSCAGVMDALKPKRSLAVVTALPLD
ncbi:MAG: hypothetical protein AAB289_03975 [Chloroflexota bacterium]